MVYYTILVLFLITSLIKTSSYAFHGGSYQHHGIIGTIYESYCRSSSLGISRQVSIVPRRLSRKVSIQLSLSSEGLHAAEVFSLMDADGNGKIDESELKKVLKMLDLDASNEDISILFRHLDKDGSKEVDYQEFLSWYSSAAASVQRETNVVMDALLQRRTVNDFDPSISVPEGVLRRAVKAAIAAPCHGLTEPWRFIQLGKKTISEIATLNAADLARKDPAGAELKRKRWTKIPGWCVVTSVRSPSDSLREREDYAATCCAIQNFLLAMWAEGVGTKWTTGPITRTEQFAKLCEIDLKKEQVVGCIWYGFASGGLASVPMPERKRSVDDVLSSLP
jgi:Ca2+-binding EF-hand superfamily protein